jgi:hypothetical protein
MQQPAVHGVSVRDFALGRCSKFQTIAWSLLTR